MEKTFYLAIKDVEGDVKVKGFEKHFELSSFNEGGINISLRPDNNGQSYRGTPSIDGPELVIKNVPGKVSSSLLKKALDATNLEEVTIHEVAMTNSEVTKIYSVKYTKAHIQFYRYLNGNMALRIGAFAAIETTHMDIDDAGKTKPFVVKYDLQAKKTA